MKKILIVIAIILAVVILILCTLCVVSHLNRYKGWQEIDVPEIGTFKIPPDWAYHRDGNRIYLTDKNVKAPTQENTYIVGTVELAITDEDAFQVFDSNARYVDSDPVWVFSNSGRIGKKEYILQGKNCKKTILYMHGSYYEGIDMLVWDDSVDYELVEKIVKSYAMHLNEGE